ncbi:MAG: hypothetical protein IK051_01010 [Rhodocyclaceae bacterium]|nr:hypothetical protein [Rhodocyclaceae bacterium]
MKLTKIALGVALAAGTVAAQAADTLWFPHVVHSGTVTTILTVIDAGGTNYVTPEPHHMHYIYKVGLNGETAAQINPKTCEESDGLYPFSKYDVQSFDVGGVVSSNNEGVLFNDPGVKNAWAGKQYARSRNVVAATPNAVGTRGYWVVEDADAAAGTLEGYATIFDYRTGSAWGYKGETFDPAAHTPLPFSAHLMPPAETTARLLVTPFDAPSMIPALPGYVNDVTVGLVPQSLDVLNPSLAIADRDENLESGAQTAQVTCVGTVDLMNMISGGGRAHVQNGGWIKVATILGTGGTPTANAVVYQLDFGGQGATNSQMNGVGYPGTWNNLIVRQ